MRRQLVGFILSALMVVIVPAVNFAQNARPGGAGGAGQNQRGAVNTKTANSNEPFDPHDLSGYWDRSGGGDRGMGPKPGQGVPEMTPLGKKLFEASKPSYGPRSVPPAVGNDIVGSCNPQGMPRLIFFPRPVEFIQLPGKLVQIYQWHRGLREIWMDGRELPKEQPDIRTWYGYSVGRWEGNTLVVDSLGYDDRGWLDMYGYPRSDEMKMQERYTRVDHDRIELQIIVTDPKIYTKPWVSETKTFRMKTKEDMAMPGLHDAKGWYGLMEEMCVPLDEVDQFNARIRNPAGGVIQ